jgi:putative phosphoribosyl transferase
MIIFRDREDAGARLAQRLHEMKPGLRDALVLGIPRGGVPIGFHIAKILNAPLDILVLRKLPIPDDPEAGFGAVTLDKIPLFNVSLLEKISLSEREISEIVSEVAKEVDRRNKRYRGKKPFPVIEGRSVILADDGLASGFTMLAAIRFVREHKARDVVVAVPVAHEEAFRLIEKKSDKIIVLHISTETFFAVASFYREFPDMKDEEVVAFLREGNE